MVDAFVAPTDQREASAIGKLVSHRLIEPATTGTEQEQRARRLCSFHGAEQRLRLHHHAGAAAERCVVDGAMQVGGVVARVVHAQVEHPEQALRAEAVDQTRKDGEDVDAHRPASLR